MRTPLRCHPPRPAPAAGRHRIVHRAPPRLWQDGFPLGNGFLGAMLWGDGAPLKLTLDCSELWDSRTDDSFWRRPGYRYAELCRLIAEGRYDEAALRFAGPPEPKPALTPTKISIGRLELNLLPRAAKAGGPCEIRLDLDRAEVTGALGAGERAGRFTAFVHKTRHVLCLRLEGRGAARARPVLKPLAEICPALAGLKHPAPRRRRAGGAQVFSQEIPGGPCYTVAWSERGPEIFLAVACGADLAAAERDALAAWRAAADAGFDRLRREHRRAWRAFWAASAVALPEPEVETLWYHGIYLLGSSARRGCMPPGLQGLWAMDGVLPPWKGDYHLDMNVQETFWPAYAAGHLDLADCWCDYMAACNAPARAFTRQVFGSDGTFWPCVTMGLFKVPAGGGSPWYAMSFAWSHGGWLGWLVWLRWRYSLDRAWLARTGYPVLADIFRFFRANLVREADGRLHVPLSSSPEYHGHVAREAFCKDPAIDLALIRRTCDWIVEMEAALGRTDLTPAAREVRETLAPYPLTAKGELCLWPGKPADESHRHPSHLMAIHPAMDLTLEGNEGARKTIAASVQQLLALGQGWWAGHTYAQMISMAAVLGCGGWAHESARQFAAHWMMPNGLHVNSDWRASGMSAFSPILGQTSSRRRETAPFTMEANCGFSAGICDMLVQGWADPGSAAPGDGTVRVFPAMPDLWRDVAFRDLRTEGAFRVSAARREGRTVWVRVTAETDRNLRLRDPFEGAAATVRGGTARRDGKDYVAPLRAGQTIEFCRKGVRRCDWAAAARAARRGGVSLLGLPPA